MRELAIDRIYDTFIDEDELRICDDTIEEITNSLDPRPYSSREFLREMGAWLEANGKTPETGGVDSIVFAAYEKNVPIFIPAFSDCSAGFGLVAHQHARQGKPVVSIDSAKDFYELTKLKIENLLHWPADGLRWRSEELRSGYRRRRGDPRRPTLRCTSMPSRSQLLTLADGALSGSTLKEASSWGKVDLTYEQMVLLRSYAGAASDRRICLSHKQAHTGA